MDNFPTFVALVAIAAALVYAGLGVGDAALMLARIVDELRAWRRERESRERADRGPPR